MSPTVPSRKQRGAWYTPTELIEPMVEWLAEVWATRSRRPLRVIDPACGDGRLLVAVRQRFEQLGWESNLFGVDIDADAVAAARAAGVDASVADGLTYRWPFGTADVVIGNPPYLSQLAAATTRGGSSSFGGGAYADAAVEFLALSARLLNPATGTMALVLPQSVLASRDAAPVRRTVDLKARLAWSWWEPDQRLFAANVNVCILGWAAPAGSAPNTTEPTARPWTAVVNNRLGLPTLDSAALTTDGTVGDRNEMNANFRDEYYALVPAVSDDADGPPLVTAGLIDPGVNHWGARPVRFAKQNFAAPRVDLTKLTGRFPAWAARKLQPKVLIANQTRIIEAVADAAGEWLPGVPVTTATPARKSVNRDASGDASAAEQLVWQTAAVLTSPVASLLAWQHGAGTGLTTRTIRLSPASLGATPWPAGSLDDAVTALRNGDISGCGQLVNAAFGLSAGQTCALVQWWQQAL